jgi:hypothetical protein
VIALKIRAYIQSAKLAANACQGQDSWPLFSEEAEGTRPIAEFHPDSASICIAGMEILCVLCAVGEAKFWNEPAEYTAIGMIPCPSLSNTFIRVGLVIVTNETWFHHVIKSGMCKKMEFDLV